VPFPSLVLLVTPTYSGMLPPQLLPDMRGEVSRLLLDRHAPDVATWSPIEAADPPDRAVAAFTQDAPWRNSALREERFSNHARQLH